MPWILNWLSVLSTIDGIYVTDQYHPGVTVLPDMQIDSMFSCLGWICVQPHRRSRSAYDAQGIQGSRVVAQPPRGHFALCHE